MKSLGSGAGLSPSTWAWGTAECEPQSRAGGALDRLVCIWRSCTYGSRGVSCSLSLGIERPLHGQQGPRCQSIRTWKMPKAWFTQRLGAPGVALSHPVGRQWWAIPGLSYTAGTSIPEGHLGSGHSSPKPAAPAEVLPESTTGGGGVGGQEGTAEKGRWEDWRPTSVLELRAGGAAPSPGKPLGGSVRG